MPLNSLFSWVIQKRVIQIERFKKKPLEVQHELLFLLLKKAKNTWWGKQYNFNTIDSYNKFKQSLPLQTYSEVQPFIEKSIQGDENILWPGKTKWFAKSSGTTSFKSKFIPVTKDSLFKCHYKGGKDLLGIYYHTYPNRKLYNGKHLIIGGSAQINPIGFNSYLGDLSAIIVKNLPFWAEVRRTPSRATTLLSNWEEKLEKMARETMHENVVIIAGVPSWTLVLCNKILEITGKQYIDEVWPNLELFMHGGVSFHPYKSEFDRLMSKKQLNYIETYNASEGFFGIQDDPETEDLLLMLDYGIFYEFIPMRDYKGLDSEHITALDDVELNINYALVVTTNGGLWRYIIGDSIQFTSLLPYKFKITGRTQSYINAFGEEVIVDNAEKAIQKASELTNSQIQEFTAAPFFMENKYRGGHEWIIEFNKTPEDLEQFTTILDKALQEINSDYEAKRQGDLALQRLIVHLAPKGTFNSWLKSNNKLGGQNKIPRLNNDRTILEEILTIIHKTNEHA